MTFLVSQLVALAVEPIYFCYGGEMLRREGERVLLTPNDSYSKIIK